MYSPFGAEMFPIIGAFAGLFIIVMLWTLVWKGIALWRAAKNGQVLWFVAFLLIHTAGVLEIVYLIWFRKDRATVPFRSLFVYKASTAPESSAL
ncbi:MAG: hypothetical protein KBD05_03680 [Candidatus Pacebacteria bacterium]|nr:hypothetical protein [Candidatus Paceibacterota bacterium]